jgi:AcrR family transcriptional regulator
LIEATAPKRTTKTRELELTVASQRRSQIIEAARACISEAGLEKLTLRRVAERAQVSHATVAYYFQTRQHLIDAALLETSEEFMGVLRQKELIHGPRDLEELVETFLDAGNPSARFVVQMIDAGLHDLQLRQTHNEFVEYGRDRIERSIRVGIEMGVYRTDIDARLAAALIHTILVWYESELAAGASSPELALAVGRLALKLLEPPAGEAPSSYAGTPYAHGQAKSNGRYSPVASAGSPAIEAIEAGMLADPRLSPRAATTLVEAFKQLYGLAAGLSEANDGR